MSFTGIGYIGAWLVAFFATVRLAMAMYIIFAFDNAEQAAFYKARYLGSKAIGDIIDQSVMILTCAVVVGILAEISQTVRRRSNQDG